MQAFPRPALLQDQTGTARNVAQLACDSVAFGRPRENLEAEFRAPWELRKLLFDRFHTNDSHVMGDRGVEFPLLVWPGDPKGQWLRVPLAEILHGDGAALASHAIVGELAEVSFIGEPRLASADSVTQGQLQPPTISIVRIVQFLLAAFPVLVNPLTARGENVPESDSGKGSSCAGSEAS
jgi:hypothetical protein